MTVPCSVFLLTALHESGVAHHYDALMALCNSVSGEEHYVSITCITSLFLKHSKKVA